MQLIKKRPIALPVFKSGRWYDDFAVTGASDVGYSLTGTKTKYPGHIRLATSGGGTSYFLSLPTWYKCKNFKLESVFRRVAGSSCYISFRRINSQNSWTVVIPSANDAIELRKIVANVTTVVATKNNIANTAFHRINLEVAGPNISLCLDGSLVASVRSTDNIAGDLFIVGGFDAVANTAQGEWQYVAINPL